mmetsp:Transcript_9531/g.12878  ORF Transcript_9531/g.12878 Transcript_9531/m.12878 type:complete len:235 (+) Transcript_9531:105-809(+)
MISNMAFGAKSAEAQVLSETSFSTTVASSRSSSRCSLLALGKGELSMTMKNSFLHFFGDEDEELVPLRRVASAPGRLAVEYHKQWPSKANREEELAATQAAIAEAHDNGHCKPCHYFAFKADSCRRGSECMFCHHCSQDQVLERRMHKSKASSVARGVARSVAIAKQNRRKTEDNYKTLESSIVTLGHNTAMMQPMPTLLHPPARRMMRMSPAGMVRVSAPGRHNGATFPPRDF